MKRSERILALLLAAVLLLAGLTACGKGTDEADASAESAATADPYAEPAVVIGENDYDAMNALIDKMQNGEIAEGTVVEITGYVGASVTTHTVVVRNAEGSKSIGTTYEIDGEAEIPADGTKIHIVGAVRMGESYRVIGVPADRFEVVPE